MANHLRKQIRDGIVTAITGLTTTGTNVFASRVYPVETADLPCLLVYARSEAARMVTIHNPAEFERELDIEIVALAKATSGLDDELDQIAKEVEIAMAWPVSALANIAKDAWLTETEFDLQGTAEQPAGRMTLRYAVTYYAAVNAPDVAQ